MKSKFTLPVFIAATLLGCKASAEIPSDRLAEARRIADAILAAQIEVNGVPGMAAAVVHDGHVLWTGTAGYRDRERRLPVEPDTSFRLASVSKLVTATAAMVLYDRGALDLDAPVQAYLPDQGLTWPAISARQLAAHISGIPHYQAVDDGRGARRYASVGEAVGIFADRQLLFAPGSGYNYSSYGYTLLSAVIEARAHMPFLDFVARDITNGLDLRPDLVADARHDTVAYAFEGGVAAPAGPHDYSYSWGGAGFRGSARGVALFGARVMDTRFLSSSARGVMWEPAHLADGAPVMEDDDQVAFGWRVGTDGSGERIVHHAGVAIGARSALVLYPETSDSVSLLSNAVWVSSIEQTGMMLAAPFRAQPAAPGAPCPTWATRYEGDFGGTAIAGAARFAMVEGVCRGSLDARGGAGDWFNAFPQGDSETLPVIAIAPGDGLDRAALVTPSGSYDLRRQSDGSFVAVLGPTRRFAVRLGR